MGSAETRPGAGQVASRLALHRRQPPSVHLPSRRRQGLQRARGDAGVESASAREKRGPGGSVSVDPFTLSEDEIGAITGRLRSGQFLDEHYRDTLFRPAGGVAELHTREVAGSKPAAPINDFPAYWDDL